MDRFSIALKNAKVYVKQDRSLNDLFMETYKRIFKDYKAPIDVRHELSLKVFKEVVEKYFNDLGYKEFPISKFKYSIFRSMDYGRDFVTISAKNLFSLLILNGINVPFNEIKDNAFFDFNGVRYEMTDKDEPKISKIK